MSDIPQEDVALAAEVLTDNEVVLAILRTVSKVHTNFPDNLDQRLDGLIVKYEKEVLKERLNG